MTENNNLGREAVCDICGATLAHHNVDCGVAYCRLFPTYRPKTVDSPLREALEEIDRQVSHAMLGDWSIALKAIRDKARAALSQYQGGESAAAKPPAAENSS